MQPNRYPPWRTCSLNLREQLSDENYRRIIDAKKKSILKKTAADTVAEKVFSGRELEDIGSDVWKELWEAARNYSVSAAYKEAEYPNVSDGSRCVLCHQTLTHEAKERLISFENFVKGKMQKDATDAAMEYETVSQTIEAVPTPETLKIHIDATGILQDEFFRQVTDFFAQLKTRQNQLSGIDSEEAIPDPLLSPKWIEEANTQSKSLSELATKYDEDAKSNKREENTGKLNSLEAKKWLFAHRTAIDEEVSRLKLLNQIQEAKKLTNTRALSQKKGDLSEALITDAFVQRFNSELKALGASRLNVELVKVRIAKGKVLHKLQLKGISQKPLSDILSEGENRIISIAAFLADVTGKNNRSPFVFDDPISSLDQTYEEAVVRRLIELSHDKQVIIFTHRLSLLGTVRHFSDKKSIKPDVLSIRSADWGTGEPAPIPLSQSDIKSALNTLMNQRYQDAKKARYNGEFEYAEILLKSICSDFRTLVERSIESDLLCGVIERFQRPVHTLKLKELAKLKATDCNLLDSLMTKYSGFEHSQPTESGSEGINLQFCSILINYDLPWNPQRVEQRIGRCHRYGQKQDVFVWNFINTKNRADQRVYQLLSEKYHLFEGVFGASDEVLGEIERGVDIEQRIFSIYQNFRSDEEIDQAFDTLQNQKRDKIEQLDEEAKRALLSSMDKSVIDNLRWRKQDTDTRLSQYDEWLMRFTRAALPEAVFINPKRFVWQGETYSIEWPEADENSWLFYRLREGELADKLIQQVKAEKLSLGSLRFHYDGLNGNGQLSDLRSLRGHAGWLSVTKLILDSGIQVSEALLLAGQTEEGFTLRTESCERLLSLPAISETTSLLVTGTIPETALATIQQEQLSARLREAEERNHKLFEEESQKLERWADDVMESYDAEIKGLSKQIKEAQKLVPAMPSLEEKVQQQRLVKKLQGDRRRMSLEYHQRQEEIEQEQETLLELVQSQLRLTPRLEPLFTIRWELE